MQNSRWTLKTLIENLDLHDIQVTEFFGSNRIFRKTQPTLQTAALFPCTNKTLKTVRSKIWKTSAGKSCKNKRL